MADKRKEFEESFRKATGKTDDEEDKGPSTASQILSAIGSGISDMAMTAAEKLGLRASPEDIEKKKKIEEESKGRKEFEKSFRKSTGY